jgi:uncharacterized protein YkwD
LLASTLACDFEGQADDGDTEGSGSSGELTDTSANASYCNEVSSWPDEHAAVELEVLAIVNEYRGRGANCGGQPFGSASPLRMNAALRCAARKHSLDMATRGFFDHDNPDGQDPFDRIELAGYDFRAAGENIAAGQPTAQEAMDSWMTSPGHCMNIMSAEFTEIGVGYTKDASGSNYPHLWTQTFGAPW